MLTFNPGPSKLSDNTKKYINLAVSNGILELSHRSSDFTKFSKKTIEELRKFFRIPDDYKIFYTSSATEAMELSVANCCKNNSFHFVNGSFSKLFSQIAIKYGKNTKINEVALGEQNDYKNTVITKDVDFITITHNETSTGVMCNLYDIEAVRKNNPQAILAMDIVSSAGATPINISLADIWLFSVQKCFGLPAGLGIMIVSPSAFEKAVQLEKDKLNLAGLFSFSAMWEKMNEKYQTVCTPNSLNIYLLGQVLADFNQNGGLDTNIELTEEKCCIIENFLAVKASKFNYFVKNPEHRSKTVLCLEASPEFITKWHEDAIKKNIILGKGYGNLKSNTFRIANFPAITITDMYELLDIIKQ